MIRFVHPLEPTQNLTPSPANFGVVVSGDRVFVSKAWVDFIGAYTTVFSLEHLISTFFHYSHIKKEFCERFGWTEDDLINGRSLLIKTLEGVVDAHVLLPLPSKEFAFGALAPEGVSVPLTDQWAWEHYHMAGVCTGTELSKEQFLLWWHKLLPDEKRAWYTKFRRGEPVELNCELVFAD